MPVRREFAITAAAVAAAGVLVAGVTAVSNASTTSQVAAATGYARGAEGDGSSDDPGMGRGPGGHGHTEVTGDELARVTAAVKAQDSSITVDTVRKDPDGSYDVLGTKDGNPVMVEVSKDLETIETRAGGPGRHGGGRADHEHTAVTGDELARVTAAVKAEDPSITVDTVRKDPDGSYDVLGTKDGNPVMVEVSKDLQTIETRTGGPRHHGQDQDPSPTTTESAPSTT